MANSFNGSNNQWEVDTVDNTVIGFHGDKPLYVKSVTWVGATTAGHVASITDANGDVLMRFEAEAADVEMHRVICQWWRRGFRVPTLGSGRLYIALG